jgi:hypothetical protein
MPTGKRKDGKICGAKVKRTGLPCQSFPMANGRCRNHGGATPKGKDHPRYKHYDSTRWVRFLPETAKAVYDSVASHKDWASLREDLDLMDTRVALLVQALPNGEPPSALWKNALGALNREERAMASGDRVALAKARYDLRMSLESGVSETVAWDEIRSVMRDRKAIVESERKRMVEERQIITADQAAAVFYAVTEIVRDLVPLENKRAAALILQRIMPAVAIPENTGD